MGAAKLCYQGRFRARGGGIKKPPSTRVPGGWNRVSPLIRAHGYRRSDSICTLMHTLLAIGSGSPPFPLHRRVATSHRHAKKVSPTLLAGVVSSLHSSAPTPLLQLHALPFCHSSLPHLGLLRSVALVGGAAGVPKVEDSLAQTMRAKVVPNCFAILLCNPISFVGRCL